MALSPKPVTQPVVPASQVQRPGANLLRHVPAPGVLDGDLHARVLLVEGGTGVGLVEVYNLGAP